MPSTSSPLSTIFYQEKVAMLRALEGEQPILCVVGGVGFSFKLLQIMRFEKISSIPRIEHCNTHIRDVTDDECLLYCSLMFPLLYLFYFWKLRFDSSLEDLQKSDAHPPATPQVLNIGRQVTTLPKVAATCPR